jgi:hypothetical protein
MRCCIRVGLFCVVAMLALLGTLPARPVLAQGVTCTVNQGSTVRDFPSASANSLGSVAKNQKVAAVGRYSGGGADWVHLNAGNMSGWLNARRVGGCNWKSLRTETPARQARVPGYTPALDQTGPDANTVFVPKDVSVSVDGFNLFRDYLVINVDPTAYVAEFGNTVSSVEFQIQDDQGNDVYRHNEENAPYCLWGDSGADCDVVWNFNATDFYWPTEGSGAREASDTPIDPGALYNVTVYVHYDEGSNDRWQFKMRLIPRGLPAAAVYVKPSLDFSAGTLNFEDAEARVQMDQLASAQGEPTFRDGMAFGLALLNGVENGPGVSSVVFEVRDEETGETVYAHQESAAPYCVFGNSSGRPYCDAVWRFADTGYAWPDSDEEFGIAGGQPLQFDHPYYAVMTAYDGDGNYGAEWAFHFTVTQ